MDAEQGYKSACDDLKEAEAYLEKRKQMREELERELREYNLKHFISTGFTEKGKANWESGLDNTQNIRPIGQ